jgi:hypothetical protein
MLNVKLQIRNKLENLWITAGTWAPTARYRLVSRLEVNLVTILHLANIRTRGGMEHIRIHTSNIWVMQALYKTT